MSLLPKNYRADLKYPGYTRIHCDDRPDQLQRLRLRAALGALPEGYRGRAVPHHLRLRAAIQRQGCSPKTRRGGSRSNSQVLTPQSVLTALLCVALAQR